MNNKFGFKLIKSEFSDDLNGTIYEFEHIKTGALLTLIENDDENRVFMIGFRTPSENSTGVAHIMEHSTLCGSEKYPVKEPFVELAKGSINTFLNAMTYSDKTVYPIASTNEKDFRNLMDVYLDAVFFPKIYENPYTFMQEGWHYHLEDKDEPLTYNGVVYNEMKGVFSDPDTVLETETYKALLPDTIYSQESGGNPDNIPDLTYEDFINFHETFYHPSNAFIYLYGKLNIDEQLEYLNSWLDRFDKEEINIDIKLQEPKNKLIEVNSKYPILPGEPKEKKDKIAYSFLLDSNISPSELRQLNVAIDILLGNNSSILKRKLLEDLDVGDISVQFDTSIKQPILTIALRDTSVNQKEKLINTVDSVLNEIYENGFDEDDLLAAINSHEFRTLESMNGESGSYPRGLILGLYLYEYWLYHDNPFIKLKFSEQLEDLKALKDSRGFEELIKKHFIDNNNRSIVLLEPDETLNAQKTKALQDKLQNYKNSLSEDELNQIIETTKNLIEKQNAEDSKEDLEKIPRLAVNEIDKNIKEINWEEFKLDNYPVLYIENNSNIIYLDLNFDAQSLNPEDLQYFALFETLLGSLGTENYSDQQLRRLLDINTGGIDIYDHVVDNLKTQKTNVRMTVRTSLRADNIQKALELLSEVIKNTIFDEKDLIKNIIAESRLSKKSSLQNSGHLSAALRTQAKVSKKARIIEEIEGIEFYNFLADLDDNFEDKWTEIYTNLNKIKEKIFNSNALTIALTCKKKDLDQVLENLKPLIADFSTKPINEHNFDLSPISKTEAFIVPGNVMYNAQGGLVDFDDDTNIGSLRVLKTILSMDYLWNKIRVLGGAYGASFNFGRDGQVYMATYRDPNLEKTYENFENVVDYINELDLDQSDIDKYIIGTISGLDTPISTKAKLNLASNMYFMGITNEDRQKERDQILSTNLENLKNNAIILENALKQNNYSSIGAENIINQNKTRFEDINYVS